MNLRLGRRGIAVMVAGLVLGLGWACGCSKNDKSTWSTVYSESNSHWGISKSVPFSIPEGPVRVRVEVTSASADGLGTSYRLVNVDPDAGASRVVGLVAITAPTPGVPGRWRGEFQSEGSVPAGHYRLVYRSRSSGPMDVEVLVKGTGS